MLNIFLLLTVVFRLSSTCIPTQDSSVDPAETAAEAAAARAAAVRAAEQAAAAKKANAARLSTVPPECAYCGPIYESDGCVADSGGYGGGTANCPDVDVNYVRGPLADGYGDSETCSITVACPSGSNPIYIYDDDTQSSAGGDLVATCSENEGIWYQQESTTEVKNVFCREP